MKNQYQITHQLVKAWAKEYHLHGKANILLFVLWFVVALMGLIGTVIGIAARLDFLDIYISVLMLLIASYKLIFSRFVVWNNRYKMMVKTYGVPEWTRTIEFLEDEIVYTEHTTVIRYRYEQIERILKKGNVILLLCNNRSALRLYEDAFVEGSWAECQEKIASKTKK